MLTHMYITQKLAGSIALASNHVISFNLKLIQFEGTHAAYLDTFNLIDKYVFTNGLIYF